MYNLGFDLMLAFGLMFRDSRELRMLRLLAFGRMTIAHRLVRVLVLEQLYRGFRIVRGEPYHRE